LALLGEYLSAMQWLAIALIVAASVGSSVTAQRGKRVPAVPLPG
jgi:inner membrane transporter RhtA